MSAAGIVSALMSALSPETKQWYKTTLSDPKLQHFARTHLSDAHNVPDSMMDDVIFQLKRHKDDGHTDGDFAKKKRTLKAKINAGLQKKLECIKPAANDPLFNEIKKEFNELDLDHTPQEEVEYLLFETHSIAVAIEEESIATEQAMVFWKNQTISKMVKEIETSEQRRKKEWKKKKKDGLVKGQRCGSAKNHKVTTKYSQIRDARNDWKDRKETTQKRQNEIQQILDTLAVTVKETRDVMGGVETEVVRVVKRLMEYKRKTAKQLKTIDCLIEKLIALTNQQLWKAKSGCRNGDYEKRSAKYDDEKVKRQEGYHDIKKKKKKNHNKNNNTNSNKPKTAKKKQNNNTNSKKPKMTKKKKNKKTKKEKQAEGHKPINEYFGVAGVKRKNSFTLPGAKRRKIDLSKQEAD
eukprot:83721_1